MTPSLPRTTDAGDPFPSAGLRAGVLPRLTVGLAATDATRIAGAIPATHADSTHA